MRLCECGCGRPTRLAHQTDRHKGWIKGQPLRFINGHGRRRPLADRLWEKIDVRGPDECWPWTGCRNAHGYGRIGIGADWVALAHRVVWEIVFGPIPDEDSDGNPICVLHRCDNPPCCNSRHLWLGTQADNVADAIGKGRAKLPPRNPRDSVSGRWTSPVGS